MAGSTSATLKAAGIRGLGVALLTSLATYASLMLQIDDCKRGGQSSEAKAAYKACQKAKEDQEDDAIWASILAGLTALGVRAGVEGGYDFRRQKSGAAPKASDVQAGQPV
jgi:hypothetical protein